MPDTPTPNYGLIIGLEGGDKDIWGAQRNTNMNTIDAQMKINEDKADASVKKAGDTMTGNLIVPDETTEVDVALNQVSAASWFLPLIAPNYNADLNDLPKEVGLVTNVVLGTLATNFPPSLSEPNQDVVEQRMASLTQGVQTYYHIQDDDFPDIFTRQFRSSVWQDWIRMTNDADLAAVADTIPVVRWANINGATGNPTRAPGLGCTKTSTGRYTVTLNSPAVNDSYGIVTGAARNSADPLVSRVFVTVDLSKPKTVNEFSINVVNSAGAFLDTTELYVEVKD